MFSVVNDLLEYNYCEAMWGYSLCAFEVMPDCFNIHVADEGDKIVCSRTFQGPVERMAIELVADFYDAAVKAEGIHREYSGKTPFHGWLIVSIEPLITMGNPKQYLMAPDKAWKLYWNAMFPPQAKRRVGKSWKEKVASGEVKPCKADFTPVATPEVGKQYHLSWASAGAVWRLVSVDGGDCTLMTSTGKTRVAKVKDLRHVRANEPGRDYTMPEIKPEPTDDLP